MSLLKRRIEFIEFQRGSEVWAYTFDSSDLVYQRRTYSALRGLKRSRLNRSGDPTQEKLDLTLPLDTSVVGEFIPRPTYADMTLKLFSLWKGDATASLKWSGFVSLAKPTSPSVAVITGMPSSADAASNGLTRNWQKACPLVLYSQGLGMCNADPTPLKLNGTVTLSDGVTLQAAEWAARADNDFRAGFIEWTEGLHIERRYVTASAGDTLTLLSPASIPVGTSVAAYSGCDHSPGANGCAKFNNNDNFGGQPNIPDKNPMGANPIF